METDGNECNVVWIGIVGSILRDSDPNIWRGVMLSEFDGWFRQTTNKKSFFTGLPMHNKLNGFRREANLHVAELNWEKRVGDVLDHCHDLFGSLSRCTGRRSEAVPLDCGGENGTRS